MAKEREDVEEEDEEGLAMRRCRVVDKEDTGWRLIAAREAGWDEMDRIGVVREERAVAAHAVGFTALAEAGCVVCTRQRRAQRHSAERVGRMV